MAHHRTPTRPTHHPPTPSPRPACARAVTACVDGSPASMHAADWAAREALLRDVPLRLLHAGAAPDHPDHSLRAARPAHPAHGAHGTHAHRPRGADRGRSILDRAAIALSYEHPALEIHARHPTGPTATTLVAASAEAGTLVLGSHGRAGAPGPLIGSVAAAVSARAPGPVVLVRAGGRPDDAHTPAAGGTARTSSCRPVVLGLDPWRCGEALIAYAFDAAAARGAPLHVVHAWTMAPLDAYAPGRVLPSELTGLQRESREALRATLEPWRRRYPDTAVVERVGFGRAAHQLLRAATGASLLVIGRRGRLAAHLGRTAHSALRHVPCPVAVVPHD